MRSGINKTTKKWCDAANVELTGNTLSAKKLIQIMQWTVTLGTKATGKIKPSSGGAAFSTDSQYDEEYEEDDDDEEDDEEEDYLNYSGYLEKSSEIFKSINEWLKSNDEPILEDEINVCRILKNGPNSDEDDEIAKTINSYFTNIYDEVDISIRDELLRNLIKAIDEHGKDVGFDAGSYLKYIEEKEAPRKETPWEKDKMVSTRKSSSKPKYLTLNRKTAPIVKRSSIVRAQGGDKIYTKRKHIKRRNIKKTHKSKNN